MKVNNELIRMVILRHMLRVSKHVWWHGKDGLRRRVMITLSRYPEFQSLPVETRREMINYAADDECCVSGKYIRRVPAACVAIIGWRTPRPPRKKLEREIAGYFKARWSAARKEANQRRHGVK